MTTTDYIISSLITFYFMSNMYMVGYFHIESLRFKIFIFFFGLPFAIIIQFWKNPDDDIEYLWSVILDLYDYARTVINPKEFIMDINWKRAQSLLENHKNNKNRLKVFTMSMFLKRLKKLNNIKLETNNKINHGKR